MPTPNPQRTYAPSQLHWKCDMPQLIREMFENLAPKATHGVLQKPFQIMFSMFDELGRVAAEIDDPRLNCMMIRLSIYECAIPGKDGHKEAMAYLKEHYKYTPDKPEEVEDGSKTEG